LAQFSSLFRLCLTIRCFKDPGLQFSYGATLAGHPEEKEEEGGNAQEARGGKKEEKKREKEKKSKKNMHQLASSYKAF
jgi:hypothetical protein